MVTQEFNVRDFDQIRLSTSGVLYIEQGDTFNLAVTTDNITLPKLSAIDLSGSAEVRVEDFQADSLIINLSGSGDVTFINLDAKSLASRISGSGNVTVENLVAETVCTEMNNSGEIRLAGKVDTHEIKVSGSGDVLAENLQVAGAQVTVNGSGDVTAWAVDSMDVRISGRDNVQFFGSPKLTQTLSGAGNIVTLGAKQSNLGELSQSSPQVFEFPMNRIEGVNMKSLTLIFLMIAIFMSVFPAYAQSTPAFDPIECPMPVPEGTEVVCGAYEVPENRSNPNSRMIRMPFTIFKSNNPNPAPDPVVYVSSGGPGGSSLDALAAHARSAYLQERDFIFVEQRSNKYVESVLDCPEVQMAMFANFSSVDAREAEIASEVDAARYAVTACLRKHRPDRLQQH